jgi:hypothetical protein
MAKPQVDTHHSVTEIHGIESMNRLNFSVHSGLLRPARQMQVNTRKITNENHPQSRRETRANIQQADDPDRSKEGGPLVRNY